MALCVQTFHNNDISIFETFSSCFSDLDVEPYVVTSALTLIYQVCSSSCYQQISLQPHNLSQTHFLLYVVTSALTLVFQACSSSCHQHVSFQPHILDHVYFLHFVQAEGFPPTYQFQFSAS